MYPLDSEGRKASHLSDRTFIGGPTSVRGFSLRGIGPYDRADALGGDVAFEAAVALSFPLVPAWKSFMKGHVFINAGNAMLFSNAWLSKPGQAFNQLLGEAGASLGTGLVFKVLDMARLELNYAIPLKMKDSFRFHEGLQIGLGIDFL